MAGKTGKRRGAARLAASLAWLVSAAGLLGASCQPRPFAPEAGLADWRAPAVFAVRDGMVDLAGGNLLLRRTDLAIETRLGTQVVSHAYSSATDRWTWSFDMTYAAGLFTDDTGARHELGALAPGPIAGTRWRKVDGATIETRGGLRYAFAPDGRLARVAWRNAAYPSLELVRSGDGTLRIAQCTAPGACADVFVVHYAGADVVAIDDRAGRRVRYGWSGGRLQWVETPFEREAGLPARRYHYTLAAGRPTAIVVENPERERARYELDPIGRVTAYQLVGEESPRWRIEHASRRAIVVDPLGHGTVLHFDAQRRLVERHEVATGERTIFAWTGRRATRIVGPDGLATTTSWNADDELAAVTSPSGRTLAFDYVAGVRNPEAPFSALPWRVRDAGATVVVRSFDAQGRLVSETNGAGERTQLAYGPLSTLERVELPTGQSIHFAEYGEHGQPAEVRIPASEPNATFVERRVFDAVGNLVRGIDPGSDSGTQFPGVVAREFDAARRLRVLVMSQDVDGTAQDVVFVRRSDGRLRAIQRPYGADAEFEYDAIGRLRVQRERVDGAWVETRFAWTPRGELARSERPNGMTRELAYDPAGRIARLVNSRGGRFESEVRYAYQAGRLVRKDDTTAPGPARIAWDAAGRPQAVTWPDGEQSRFAYDARDRLVSTTLLRADGTLLRQLRLGYDAAGRETQLRDGTAVVFEAVYAAGRLTALRHGNGIERTLAYDELGRLAGARSRDAAGVEREHESVLRQGRDLHGPDPNGAFRELLARYRGAAPFGEVAFVERALGFRFRDGERWMAPWLPDSGTVQWCNGDACPEEERWGLDWKRLSGLMDLDGETLPETTSRVTVERIYAKNAERNRLRRVAKRTTTEPPGPCSPCTPQVDEVVEHAYGWDAAGFATSRDGVPITWDATGHLASFGTATFAHDAEGRLRASIVAGVVVQRRFGGLVEADASGQARRLELGVVSIDLASHRRTYRHFDWRGNVRSLWDDEGRIVAVREYEAYGPARIHGATSDARGFAQGVEVAGLVMMGDRVYDPAARQFLSPDPLYNPLHQFTYAAGDPVNYWDWTGWDARATAAFRLAGSFGQFVGAATVVAAVVLIGVNPVLGAATIAALAPIAGAHVRSLYEEIYVMVYDWIDAAPERHFGPTGTHEFFVPRDFVPLAGPPQPKVVCMSGECGVQYPFGRTGGRPRPPSGALHFQFAPPSFGFGCGLLGAEGLPLLAWLAWSRRAARRRVT